MTSQAQGARGACPAVLRPDGAAGPRRPAGLQAPTHPVIVLPDGSVLEWPAPYAEGATAGWPARFAAAARMVTLLHPGPVGELVERELCSALVCAGRFGAEPFVDEDALLIRVVEHILAAVERRVAVARTTAWDRTGAAAQRRRRETRPVTDLVEPLE